MSACLVLDAQIDGGAVGNGVADDTFAIQTLIDGAPDGSVIYFPVGTYLVGDLLVGPPHLGAVRPIGGAEVGVGGGVVVAGFGADGGLVVPEDHGAGLGGLAGAEPEFFKDGISLLGDGHRSVLKRRTDAVRIASVESCQNFSVTALGFDANGLGRDGTTGGGLFLRNCRRVRVYDTYAFDSNYRNPEADEPLRPLVEGLPAGSLASVLENSFGDRNAFLFAGCSEVWVEGNLIEDQQMSFAGCQSVTIARNTVVNAIFAAIRIGAHASPLFPKIPLEPWRSIFNGVEDSDYEVVDNLINNPWTHGIKCGTGPFPFGDPVDEGNTLQRIRISGNIVTKFGVASAIHGTEEDVEVVPSVEARSRMYGCGIVVGRGADLRLAGFGENKYSDITIEANDISFNGVMLNHSHGIQFDPSELPNGTTWLGYTTRSPGAHFSIRNNTVTGAVSIVEPQSPQDMPGGFSPPWGIDVKALSESVIGGNGVHLSDNGIRVNEMWKCHICANRVQVSNTGYERAFLGYNVFVHNVLLGDPARKYEGGSYGAVPDIKIYAD